MTLTKLTVENFQSLEKIELDLAPFTVVEGSSNSGKSAVLRALKAVVRNVHSPSAVRVGAKQFTAQIGLDNDVAVAIERGPSQSTYRVLLPDGEEAVFTKAGRTVPEEVQKVLGLPSPEGPDLAFSSQIDPPFLLAETGSTAAKMLGDLTNVSRLHAAAREANRRRLDASKEHKIRVADATACAEKLHSEFSDLKEQTILLAQAQALMDEIRAQAREMETLKRVLGEADVANTAQQDLEKSLASLPPVQDIASHLSEIEKYEAERSYLSGCIEDLLVLVEEAGTLKRQLVTLTELDEQTEQDYLQILREAGTCPTCGADTRGHTHE